MELGTTHRIPARIKAQNGYPARRWSCKNSLNICTQMSPVYSAPWDLDKVVQTLFYMTWNVQYPFQDLQVLRNLLSQSTSGVSVFPALHLVMVLYLCPVWLALSWSLQQQRVISLVRIFTEDCGTKEQESHYHTTRHRIELIIMS